MALLRKPYRACGKQSMPPEWFDPVPHTHVALDDAIEQGQLFCNMLKANFGAQMPHTDGVEAISKEKIGWGTQRSEGLEGT